LYFKLKYIFGDDPPWLRKRLEMKWRNRAWRPQRLGPRDIKTVGQDTQHQLARPVAPTQPASGRDRSCCRQRESFVALPTQPDAMHAPPRLSERGGAPALSTRIHARSDVANSTRDVWFSKCFVVRIPHSCGGRLFMLRNTSQHYSIVSGFEFSYFVCGGWGPLGG